MEITANLVKDLREKTGAGMMDCKKALVETNGDIDKAIDYLREKGIAKAAKKAERIAAEGLCNVVTEGDYATLYELNSETDFVAKNEKFLDLLYLIGAAIITKKVDNVDAALAIDVKGKTIEQYITEGTATIGEKLSLRRVILVKKAPAQIFGSYKHNGGKIAVLTILEGGKFEDAKDIAMHVAALKPQFLNSSEVSPELLKSETDITKKATEEEFKELGKPLNNIDKVVEGRVSKWLKEICLEDQVFVKGDGKETVRNYLNNKHAKVVKFLKLEVGEGIEKRVNDFAAEVAAASKL